SLRTALISLFLAGGFMAAGCVQMPTESHRVPDLRPQISFRIADASLGTSRVVVDGLDMGTVASFLEGKASLRLLPGMHAIRIEGERGVLLDEKAYLPDGVARTFILSRGF